MAVFLYKARTELGAAVRGSFSAPTKDEAINLLSAQGLFITELSEKIVQVKNSSLNSKQLSEFSKELSMMLQSGLPIVKALNIMANQETLSQKQKKIFKELLSAVKRGTALSEAMRSQGKAFPELFINMFYSGEVVGNLSDVCEKMSAYYMSEYRMKRKISAATMYPKILAALTVGALLIVFTFVLPPILDMVDEENMPAISLFMKNISEFMRHRWYLVLAGAGGLVGLFFYLRSMGFIMYQWSRFLLGIPKMGSLLRTIYSARFARTLSSLYSSGIQLPQAVLIASTVINNKYVESFFEEVLKKINNGQPVSKAISGVEGFNKKLESIIEIGEESGRLDEILESSAASFEYDTEMSIERMLALLEPVFLVIMALVIGTVMVSALLPIFAMYESLGSV
ncbi:MAG: type II secretion system F family protein [Defluviitaleaceae bacterium]|nr:type II secretion system F family protein [Defluviitaleaceae bacterium]